MTKCEPNPLITTMMMQREKVGTNCTKTCSEVVLCTVLFQGEETKMEKNDMKIFYRYHEDHQNPIRIQHSYLDIYNYDADYYHMRATKAIFLDACR